MRQTTYITSGIEMVAIPPKADAVQLLKDLKSKTGLPLAIDVYDDGEIEDNVQAGYKEQPKFKGSLYYKLVDMMDEYRQIAQSRWDAISQDIVAYN